MALFSTILIKRQFYSLTSKTPLACPWIACYTRPSFSFASESNEGGGDCAVGGFALEKGTRVCRVAMSPTLPNRTWILKFTTIAYTMFSFGQGRAGSSTPSQSVHIQVDFFTPQSQPEASQPCSVCVQGR